MVGSTSSEGFLVRIKINCLIIKTFIRSHVNSVATRGITLNHQRQRGVLRIFKIFVTKILFLIKT